MLVCYNHVKNALNSLIVPHVKKVQYNHCTCSFCNNEAKIEIFYSIPFFNTRRKIKKATINMMEVDYHHQK
ncbi:hypothetical protein J2Y67_004627 [Neobacillus niacini]|nr:hypothetical protein [Neobacillus niacini]